jgi:hypothetical protein
LDLQTFDLLFRKMNWLELTAEDLNDYKVGKLMDALRTKALASGQSDPFDLLAADAVAHLRRKIAAHAANTLDARLYTIPKGLKSIACRRVVAAMKGRLEVALTEDERRQLERDEADLNRIADGKDPVDTPDKPATLPDVAVASNTPRFTPRPRSFTRSAADGI